MKLRPLICCCLCSYVLQATAGIPEPGLTLYGIVKNDLGGATIRVTEGTIVWTIAPAPPASGPTVHLTTVLTNINNQFSYVLDVPFESAYKTDV